MNEKYIIINIHGLDKWSHSHDALVGQTVTLCSGHDLQRSMFGFEFVKGWFHLENSVEGMPENGNLFFIGVQLQTSEDNTKENGVMVVAP